MKTDQVLTTGEYLAMCCDGPKRLNPPARDAHHIPITAEGDIKPKDQVCRFNRWGRMSRRCPEERKPRLCPASDELWL